LDQRILRSQSRPTKCAPDVGDSHRFTGCFYTPTLSRADGVPPPAPAQVTQTVGRLSKMLSNDPSCEKMTKNDWKEFVIYGLGGLVLFLVAGYASVIDILSYLNKSHPLFVYYSKMSGQNELGVVFTLILAALSLIGLFAFIFYTYHAYKKLRKNY
jgi:hypothetical protein